MYYNVILNILNQLNIIQKMNQSKIEKKLLSNYKF